MSLIGIIGQQIRRRASSFIQYLTSLTYVDSNIIGLTDTIDGNNTTFANANCFCSVAASSDYILLDSMITLSVTWSVSFYFTDWGINSMIIGNTATGQNFIFVKTTSIQVRIDSEYIEFYESDVTDDMQTILDDKSNFISVSLSGTILTLYLYSLTSGLSITRTKTISGTGILYINEIGGWQGLADSSMGGCLYNLYIGDYHYPLSENLPDPTTQIYYDDSANGNNGTLTNGVSTNIDIQSYYFKLQEGFLTDGVNQIVPILADGTAFADGTALTNSNAFLQTGSSWLNDGTTMLCPEVQTLIDADIYNVFFDTTGTAKDVTFDELETAISTYPDTYGGDVVSGKTISNIYLK